MSLIVPKPILKALETEFGIALSFVLASGGCINNGGVIQFSKKSFFIKWNDAVAYPGMLSKEALGLKLLKKADAVRVPNVISEGVAENFQFILLEKIEAAGRSHSYWKNFGEQLATLHQSTSGQFGLDHDNYIGSLKQENLQRKSWIEFFIEMRLKRQLARAKHLPTSLRSKFDVLFEKLPGLLVIEKPALLHGDLWGGNILVDEKGEPCLIDPAVYYGHREVDLAMTTLFGGFDMKFLDAYNYVFPLENGFEERFELYNLYPLLVHVNLFGGSYLSQVQAILRRFV